MRLVHWIVTLPVTVVLADFAVANQQTVEVVLWPVLVVPLPLWAVVLVGLALGFLAGLLVAALGGGRWRRAAKRERRRAEDLAAELRAVETRLGAGGSPASGSPMTGTTTLPVPAAR